MLLVVLVDGLEACIIVLQNQIICFIVFTGNLQPTTTSFFYHSAHVVILPTGFSV